eukprot:scaffold559_cov190-Alexandrium_tamarense.AAC.65
MKRTSFLDCQSIGQSLKRVKISTSPGELRLDSDLTQMISGKKWTSTTHPNNGNPMEPLHSMNNTIPSSSVCDRRDRIHNEISCANARLTRDPVDPLRLRLTCLYRPPSSSPSNHPLPLERWTFLIQMPRMYPHVPPSIRRVQRDVMPSSSSGSCSSNENVGWNNTMSSDFIGWVDAWERGRASAAMVASSVMQGHTGPPVPEKVLIGALPPSRPGASTSSEPLHSDEFEMSDGNPHTDGEQLMAIDAATSVYNAWSPVSSLGDLIDFLMDIPGKRREWWAKEDNRKHHQQQQRFLRTVSNSGEVNQVIPNPTITPTFSMGGVDSGYQQQYFVKQQQFPPSPCDMDADDGNNTECMMIEDQQNARHERRRINPFITNRFDVGYERGTAMLHHWRVR